MNSLEERTGRRTRARRGPRTEHVTEPCMFDITGAPTEGRGQPALAAIHCHTSTALPALFLSQGASGGNRERCTRRAYPKVPYHSPPRPDRSMGTARALMARPAGCPWLFTLRAEIERFGRRPNTRCGGCPIFRCGSKRRQASRRRAAGLSEGWRLVDWLVCPSGMLPTEGGPVNGAELRWLYYSSRAEHSGRWHFMGR